MKKIVNFSLIFLGLSALLVNITLVSDNNSSDARIDNILKQVFANESAPPSGNRFGKTLYNCSHTFRGGANTKVTFTIDGIDLPITLTLDGHGEASWSCTNCAWQCNLNGVNLSCSDKNCPTFH